MNGIIVPQQKKSRFTTKKCNNYYYLFVMLILLTIPYSKGILQSIGVQRYQKVCSYSLTALAGRWEGV